MSELEEHIKSWIEKTSKVRPELGNFALCPYSSKATYLIVETNADEIGPIHGYDFVFFVVEDYFDVQSVEFWVKYYNQRFPEWIFFEDCPQNKTYIQGIPTSNGKYNIITMQNREKLYQARHILAKTGYYHHWNDELLDLILGDDQKMIENR